MFFSNQKIMLYQLSKMITNTLCMYLKSSQLSALHGAQHRTNSRHHHEANKLQKTYDSDPCVNLFLCYVHNNQL